VAAVEETVGGIRAACRRGCPSARETGGPIPATARVRTPNRSLASPPPQASPAELFGAWRGWRQVPTP